MNLLAALWRPFAKSAGIADAATDSWQPEPAGAGDGPDSEPDGFGVAPIIDVDIQLNPGAPSTLVQTGEPEPASASTLDYFPWRPAHIHAEMLLAALLEWGFGGRKLASAQITFCHKVMCARLHWQVVPWNLVAEQFRKLTRQPKKYRWHRKRDGTPVRLAAYSIPNKIPSSLRPVAGDAA